MSNKHVSDIFLSQVQYLRHQNHTRGECAQIDSQRCVRMSDTMMSVMCTPVVMANDTVTVVFEDGMPVDVLSLSRLGQTPMSLGKPATHRQDATDHLCTIPGNQDEMESSCHIDNGVCTLTLNTKDKRHHVAARIERSA
jgi:hypothetical protein